MFQEQFVRQIQEDSFVNILRVTAVIAAVGICIQFAFLTQLQDTRTFVLLGVHIATVIVVSRWSWKLIQNNKQEIGAYLFIGGYLLLITFDLATTDNAVLASLLPYCYAYFIIISSTLIRPQSSFDIWFISLVLLIVALFYKAVPLTETFVFLIPVAVNLTLAVASFFTTVDWQEAVESASILQYRAQQRRDELFAVQAELERSNGRMQSLYRQLFTSVEVGQRIVSLLDRDVLLQQVTDLIKTRLEFIYVGIFLLEQDKFLTLQTQIDDAPIASSSNAYITTDQQNPIAYAVIQRRDIVISNVNKSELQSHPYRLPRTMSEVGLPLLVGEKLYGVLNIQSHTVNGFSDENLPILRLLADEVAIALHNAELFKLATSARQDAERANEIKSRFLASMSHELRTPLNAILNFTGFVADGIFGPVNSEQVDALEKSLDSGNHLLSLINDILDLSKIEAGAMDMFIEEVNISALVNSLAATAKGLLKNKPINLVLDIDQDLPSLQGDKRRLRQVLLNLVSNAVKFTKDGSITISAQRQGDAVQISVQDTGLGIPPEHQDRVFESFHQVENEIYNELGTGLGLPISKHFVEAHNGQIWLESAEGVGTTFYIQLPLSNVIDEPAIDFAWPKE